MTSDEVRDRRRVPPSARLPTQDRSGTHRASPGPPAQASGVRALPASPRRRRTEPLGAQGSTRARTPAQGDHATDQRHRLGRDDDEQTAIEDITAAQQLVLDDFFTYNAIRTDELDHTDEIAAVRFHITAQLAARTFEQFTLDIGFTDSIPATPDTIKTSDLLAFAGIDAIDLPALPLSHHLAEKVHAYTRTYGATARRSNRPKDLVDILLIAASEPIDARALRNALESTFAERQQHELPSSLPTPPSEWADPYRRLAAGIGVPSDLSAAFAEAATFLDPILAGSSDGAWDAAHKRWT